MLDQYECGNFDHSWGRWIFMSTLRMYNSTRNCSHVAKGFGELFPRIFETPGEYRSVSFQLEVPFAGNLVPIPYARVGLENPRGAVQQNFVKSCLEYGKLSSKYSIREFAKENERYRIPCQDFIVSHGYDEVLADFNIHAEPAVTPQHDITASRC